MMDQLWAKSGETKTLVDHTKDVVAAFKAMFGTIDSPSRLGLCWMRFFRLDDYARFWNATLASSLFHDWGKANNGFQNAVLGRGKQLIWHEHLGALMLGTESVHRWVSTRGDIDWDVVLSAVLTHHLRVRSDGNDEFGFAAPSADGTLIELLIEHEDFRELLRVIEARLGLPNQLPMIDRFWSFDPRSHCVDVLELRERMVGGRLRVFDKQVGGKKPKDFARRRLLWAVRAALIAADSVGSAMPRVGKRIEAWVEEALTRLPECSNDDVWNGILTPRIDELRAAKKWKDDNGLDGWNEFQVQSGNLPDRALLLAPCGSGKTLAAWRWVAERCKKRVTRVIFLYPTRATATEGFRDYVSWAPEADAALMHGTSEFDLQGMFENPKSADARSEKSFAVDPRLYSLAFWTRRIFSATVDQFFGFMQYAYGPMLMLPLLADSVVVVDEVHSFDRSMFSALKDFLREFDVPVLCMTASLQEVRKTELKAECGMAVYDEKPGELKTVADADRYTLRRTDERELFDLIQRKLNDGKRVLCVVNQVKWAQRLTQAFAQSLDVPQFANQDGIPIYCYHSRFRLVDRRNRHEQAVRAFQGEREPCLAITTQVCEMSLDMDADVLVTQVAPITALIQRMGRCNRVTTPRTDAGEIYVYAPENEKPYSRKDLDGVAEFLKTLKSKPRASQSDLEEALREFGPTQADVPKASSFLESGPYAMSGDESFRDIEEFTVPAVLNRDVGEFLDLQTRNEPTDGLVLRIPKRFMSQRSGVGERLPRYLNVAPDSHYHPAIGFCEFDIAGIAGGGGSHQ